LGDLGNDRSVASAVTALRQRFKIRVIAEGVEAILRESNRDERHGYHFSMPVLPGDIEKMLRSGSVLPQ